MEHSGAAGKIFLITKSRTRPAINDTPKDLLQDGTATQYLEPLGTAGVLKKQKMSRTHLLYQQTAPRTVDGVELAAFAIAAMEGEEFMCRTVGSHLGSNEPLLKGNSIARTTDPLKPWLPHKDSNLDKEIQNLSCYHYTMRHLANTALRSRGRDL